MRVRFYRSGNVEGSGGQAAPVSSDPVASTPAAENTGGQDQIAEDIQSLFEFDPFTPPADPAPPAAQPVEPAAVAIPASAAAAPPPADPQVTATPAVDPLLAAAQALQQTAESLPQAVREAAAPQPPAQPEPDPWTPLGDKGEALDYRQIFQQVPPQLLNALGSENPAERNQAVTGLLAISTHVAHRLAVAQSVQMMRQEFARAIPNFVQQTIVQREQQQQVFNDFYTKYPALSHPALGRWCCLRRGTWRPNLACVDGLRNFGTGLASM